MTNAELRNRIAQAIAGTYHGNLLLSSDLEAADRVLALMADLGNKDGSQRPGSNPEPPGEKPAPPPNPPRPTYEQSVEMTNHLARTFAAEIKARDEANRERP